MLKCKSFLGAIIISLILGLSSNAMGIKFGDPVNENFKYYTRTLQNNPKHEGLDIVAESRDKIKGQNAKAAEEGIVINALTEKQTSKPGTGFGGLGNVVVIQHKEGYVTVYGHLESIEVKKGDPIIKGAIIGKIDSGSRGN